MSWYGTHPKISKVEARAIAPKACRHCLYYIRVYPDTDDIGCGDCSNKPRYRLRPLVDPLWMERT